MKKDSYYLELEKEGYYETVDKRSKDYREYKKWKSSKRSEDYNKLKQNVETQSKGVGDTIAKITKATGIDKAVKFIAGEDCGCDERKKLLNEKFRYNHINCILEEDYIWVQDFLMSYKNKVTSAEQIRLNNIHNHIFRTKKTTSSCGSCVKKTIENITRYLHN